MKRGQQIDFQPVKNALEEMIVAWERYRRYDNSKRDWQMHYNCAKAVIDEYNKLPPESTKEYYTLKFISNLEEHIRHLEQYKASGQIINP